jgi:hypothetical protein
MVSKKGIMLSIMTMSIIYIALVSLIAFANEESYGGIAQYWDGTTWVNIYPELPIVAGQTVKLRILDLPAGFNSGDLIEFNVALSGWGNDYTSTSPFHPHVLVTEYALGKYVTGAIEWTSSVELTYCNTYTIKYRTNDGYPTGAYVAQGRISDNGPWGGHLHAVPEFPFGSVMALFSSLSGLSLFLKYRKR